MRNGHVPQADGTRLLYSQRETNQKNRVWKGKKGKAASKSKVAQTHKISIAHMFGRMMIREREEESDDDESGEGAGDEEAPGDGDDLAV